MIMQSPSSNLFPYTTLFRSEATAWSGGEVEETLDDHFELVLRVEDEEQLDEALQRFDPELFVLAVIVDRKSTRLNSSHVEISYAVFCLKKKNDYIKKMYRNI